MSQPNQTVLSLSEANGTQMVSQTTESAIRCSHFTALYFDTGNNSAPYLANFGLNFAICLVGVFGNTMVLLAIRKITSLHRPSKMLLGNLVLTDLGVGAITEPSYMAYLYTKVGEGLSSRSCWSAKVANFCATTLACASFMTLAAISVDRYVALFYSTRYRSIISTKRVAQALAVIWSVSVFWGTSWHWCFACHYPICLAIMGICMPLSSFCYVKVFLRLRQQQKKQLGAQSQANAEKLAKYRSTTISMLIVYALMLLCYTPYLCLVLLAELDGLSIQRLLILEYASALTFFNSAFNPFVYCWRIKDVKLTILGYARRVFAQRRAPSTRKAPTGAQNPSELSKLKARRKVAPLEETAGTQQPALVHESAAIMRSKDAVLEDSESFKEDITIIILSE